MTTTTTILLTFLLPFLVLLVGFVLNCTEKCKDDASLRIDADGCHKNLAAALHHVGAGQNHLKEKDLHGKQHKDLFEAD